MSEKPEPEKLVCVFCGKQDKPAGTTLTINCHPDNICFTDAAKSLRVCHKCRKVHSINDLYRHVMDALVAQSCESSVMVHEEMGESNANV